MRKSTKNEFVRHKITSAVTHSVIIMPQVTSHNAMMSHIARLPDSDRKVSFKRNNGKWQLQSQSVWKKFSVTVARTLGRKTDNYQQDHRNFSEFLKASYGGRNAIQAWIKADIDLNQPLTQRHVKRLVTLAQQQHSNQVRRNIEFFDSPSFSSQLVSPRSKPLGTAQNQLFALQLKSEAWKNPTASVTDVMVGPAFNGLKQVRGTSNTQSQRILDRYGELKQAVRNLTESIAEDDHSALATQLKEVNRARANLVAQMDNAGQPALLGKNEKELVALAFKDVAFEKNDAAWAEQVSRRSGELDTVLDDAATRAKGDGARVGSDATGFVQAKNIVSVLREETHGHSSLQKFVSSSPQNKQRARAAFVQKRTLLANQLIGSYGIGSEKESARASASSTAHIMNAAAEALRNGEPLSRALRIDGNSNDQEITNAVNVMAKGVMDAYHGSNTYQRVSQLRKEVRDIEQQMETLKSRDSVTYEAQRGDMLQGVLQRENEIDGLLANYFAGDTQYRQTYNALNNLHDAATAGSHPLASHTAVLLDYLQPSRLGSLPQGVRWRASEGQTQATVASHSFSQQQYDHELRHNFLKEPTDAQLADEWGVSSLFLADANRQRAVLHNENGESVDILKLASNDENPSRSRVAADALVNFTGGNKEVSLYLSRFLGQSLGNAAHKGILSGGEFSSFTTGGRLAVGISGGNRSEKPDMEVTKTGDESYQLRYQRSFQLSSIGGDIEFNNNSNMNLDVTIDIFRNDNGEMDFTVQDASNDTEVTF